MSGKTNWSPRWVVFGKIGAVKGNLEALWAGAVALPPLGGQLAVVGGRGGVKRAHED